MASTGELLQKGINAAKAKQVAEACSILKQVVELEPRNETAWLWLGGVVETDEQRITCLENVLAINPDNKAAQRGLSILKQKAAVIKPLPEVVERLALPKTPVATGKLRYIAHSKRLVERPTPPKTPVAAHPSVPPPSQATVKAKRKLSGTTIGCLVTVGLVVVVAVFCASISGRDDSTRESGPSIGENGILHVDGAKSHFVAADEEALKKLFRAIDAKDDYGMADLLLTGQVFSVKDGTRVLVVDKALYTTRIRILEGPYAGKSGWVPYEWVIAE